MDETIYNEITGVGVGMGMPQHHPSPLWPISAPAPLSDMRSQMDTKICPKCGIEKSRSGFCSNRAKPDGMGSYCKECNKKTDKAYCNYHKGDKKKYDSKYYKIHKSKRRRQNRKYYLSHKKERNEHCKIRKTKDLNFRIACGLRSRLDRTVSGNYKSGSAVRDLGCSIPEFKAYLEKLFQPGMTWDNWGAWHIDHIRPLASFNLQDREQLLVACNYNNLQPLWGGDNFSKGSGLAKLRTHKKGDGK